MRKTIGALVVMMALAAGGRLAGAQIVDPSTGMMVDAATDPMDFYGGYERAAGRMSGWKRCIRQGGAGAGDGGCRSWRRAQASTDASSECDELQ